MPATVVVGTQWGDEGKGKLVVGTKYDVTFAPAKNGANVGRVRTMKGPDGKVITLFHEDPTNPLNN